jgi:hypothetical protein
MSAEPAPTTQFYSLGPGRKRPAGSGERMLLRRMCAAGPEAPRPCQTRPSRNRPRTSSGYALRQPCTGGRGEYPAGFLPANAIRQPPAQPPGPADPHASPRPTDDCRPGPRPAPGRSPGLPREHARHQAHNDVREDGTDSHARIVHSSGEPVRPARRHDWLADPRRSARGSIISADLSAGGAHSERFR